MHARLSRMRERLRRWLWGEEKQVRPLPEDIEDAFQRLDEQREALHSLVKAMHNGKDHHKSWGICE